jgi:hypothetical protein
LLNLSENCFPCPELLGFIPIYSGTSELNHDDMRVSHKCGAIGEIGYLAKYGKIWAGISCCKSCVSNLKCWNFLPRTSRYGATHFTISTVKFTAMLPRWHGSERGMCFQLSVIPVSPSLPFPPTLETHPPCAVMSTWQHRRNVLLLVILNSVAL